MSVSLVIMAAGLGTRYGEGIKQLTPVGERGEIIMDYSIHDAIAAGFDRVVFIIRHDMEAAFRKAIGDRIEETCKKLGVRMDCAYQELDELPDGFTCPAGRTKPWGTGQAVLACKGLLDGPFAVVNADDYYGREVYQKLFSFLKRQDGKLCMAGYVLKNTLSASGGVTRGVCGVSETGLLEEIHETRHIISTPDGAEADGVKLDPHATVSMNMWGLTPDYLGLLEEGFRAFLENGGKDSTTAEFLLPIYMNALLAEKKVEVTVLPTDDRWFGMTYHEDTPGVIAAFHKFHEDGVYTEPLFSDLARK
ncbi:MAG: nucleotidyltransferase family protein [bacterium]